MVSGTDDGHAPTTGGALLAGERRLRILARVREESVVRVRDLADEFKTSQMTIRRDLVALDGEGLLKQVHGGAVRVQEAGPAPGAAAVEAPGHSAARQADGDGYVALLVPTADYYFADIVRGAKTALAEVGMSVVVMVSDYDEARERQLCEDFVSSGATAIVYAPTFTPGRTDSLSRWLFDLAVPVVLLERDIADPMTGAALSSVRTAYEKGWETSLRHLRGLGHHRIALLTHGLRQVGLDLEQVWAGAARAAGLGEDEAVLIVDPRATLSPPRAVLSAMVDRVDASGVTAIVSHCDQATLGLVNELRRRGRRIPEDLSIITNEDQIAELTDPVLSSNSPVKLVIGRTAARLAHELTTASEDSIQHVVIQPRFTDRGSTAAPCRGE